MLPWVHVHLLPNSSVLPCCVWPYDKPVGNIKTASIKEVWNGDKYKDIRKKMMNDERVAGCEQCYERQNSGSSNRTVANNEWAHHFDDLLNSTSEDGELSEFRMSYFDVRFSNICNFKCRGCSPELSSAWHGDHEKLYDYKSDRNALISILPNENRWNELREFLPLVEHAYFAGGEPLIMDEHYLILEELISLGRTDIKLSYNTNMSNLKFRNKSAQDYWNMFEKVHVSVSIDDIGKRGEYFRHGTNWKKIVENILAVKQACPHVIFSLNCTISLFNVFYIPEIHFTAVQLGLIKAGDFFANVLLDPLEYRVQELPKAFREKTKKKILDYLAKLRFTMADDPNTLHRLTASLTTVLNVLSDDHNKSSISAFLKLTEKLDSIRGESFVDVYPELAFLKDYREGQSL